MIPPCALTVDGWCERHHRRHVGRARYWAEHPTDDRVRRAWERGPAPTATVVADGLRSLARLVTSGGAIASDQVAAARLATCRGCPQLRNNTCSACGCYMPWKVRLAGMVCPLGVWAE